MDEKLIENIDMSEFSQEDEETLLNRYLTFRIGGEIYGFEIYYVTEIIGIQKVTEVPNTPNYINGITNLRGIIYPVVEVRTRFGLEKIPYTDKTCIILVRVRGMGVGLVVDNVSEVIRIEPNTIFPPPQTYKGSKSKYIRAIAKIDKDVKILLDLEKLLFDDYNNFNNFESN
jgi:purine-binding chemotaxis protein CheW